MPRTKTDPATEQLDELAGADDHTTDAELDAVESDPIAEAPAAVTAGQIVKLPKANPDDDDEPDRFGLVVGVRSTDGGDVAQVLPVDSTSLVPVYTADLGA